MTDAPDPITLDPEDPLLEHFALQHDYRERYQHALEEILALDMGDPQVHIKMRQVAEDALDATKIAEWLAANRPLPWIDDSLNPVAAKIREEVLAMLRIPK